MPDLSTIGRRLRTRSAAGTAAAVAAVLILSGCAAAGPSSSQSSPPAAVQTDAAETPQAEGSYSLVTGPATVQPIGGVVPVTGTGAPSLPATVTDFTGNSVTVTDISRILALDLYGTLAQTVIGLGLGENLVGRTSSDSDSSMADLPTVTASGHELNAEAILALGPTVVLADKTIGPPETLQQLSDAGITVVYFDSERSIEGIDDGITAVGAALGVEAAAEKLNTRVAQELADVRAEIAGMVPAEKASAVFLYIRGTGAVFFVLGEGGGAEGLMSELGLEDRAVQAGISGTRPANPEALAALNPDVLLVMSDGLASTGGVDGLLERPGILQTAAGQNRTVVDVPDGQALNFGPSTPAALLAAAKALYTSDAGQEAR
ncbi:ABC transporter substrate-binding protein [Arthrobacter sp. Helios]|uniref:heme/hemin ABC transporter substrate-binding protein n=1 Tax=Arthrobacter sp. Helios TaxID=2828862 RepID=UPI00206FBA10|nr:ABC transporter substrate-binding protein [Arthrobacter sp. Helios]UPO76994.1 ABC transporter substrate-binding protein [Arthrobacter sp. Helios]